MGLTIPLKIKHRGEGGGGEEAGRNKENERGERGQRERVKGQRAGI